MFRALIMDDTTPRIEPLADKGKRGPQRSFARGLVWALPVALTLWVLVVFLMR